MDLGLSGQVHVVTGGSRGLGHATAAVLVAEGASVVVAGRNAAAVEAAAFGLEERGPGRATGVVANLADPDTPRRLVDAALSTYGRIDGGLVSVGGPPPGTVVGTPDEAWRTAFESVFLGSVRMMRELTGAVVDSGADAGSVAAVLSTSVKSPIPGLTTSNGLRPGLAMVIKSLAEEVGPRGVRVNGLLPGRLDTERVQELDAGAGSVAAVLSTSVKSPIPGLTTSNGLRPGLAMVIKSLADEVGPRGVRVNGLLPGRLDTERVQELDAGAADPAGARARHEASIPLGRYGRPEEFGRVAAFLLSPASSFVSGAMVPVDGGLLRAL